MNIIIVFPKTEQAKNVRGILRKAGYTVDAVCTTGAAALQAAGSLDSGLVICTCRLADMMYSELYEYLPPHFQMLLIGSESQIAQRETEDIMGLSVPLKVYELLRTVEMMSAAYTHRRKKRRQEPKQRTPEENRVIGEAKALLMERNHMTETEAHRYLQKRSMDSGTDLAEAAWMILSLMG